MFIFDESFNRIESPDLEMGRLEEHTVEVTHDWVVDTEEQGHWETVAEYEGGGKDVEWRVDVPEVGHWETRREGGEVFEDYPSEVIPDWMPHDEEAADIFGYYLYVPYTEDELAQIAEDKAEAERASQEQRTISQGSRAFFLDGGRERMKAEIDTAKATADDAKGAADTAAASMNEYLDALLGLDATDETEATDAE